MSIQAGFPPDYQRFEDFFFEFFLPIFPHPFSLFLNPFYFSFFFLKSPSFSSVNFSFSFFFLVFYFVFCFFLFFFKPFFFFSNFFTSRRFSIFFFN
ncbi:hypothetical protein SEEA0100_12081, partial [Salmonella enterica subsp. enterica serovar Anatum str. USDA 100]